MMIQTIIIISREDKKVKEEIKININKSKNININMWKKMKTKQKWISKLQKYRALKSLMRLQMKQTKISNKYLFKIRLTKTSKQNRRIREPILKQAYKQRTYLVYLMIIDAWFFNF